MRPRPPSVIFGKKNPEDKDPLSVPGNRATSPTRVRSPVQAIPNGPVQPPPRNMISPPLQTRESGIGVYNPLTSNKPFTSEEPVKKDSGYDQTVPTNRSPMGPYYGDPDDEDLIDPAHGEVIKSNRSKKAVAAAQRFIEDDEDDVLRDRNPRSSLAMSADSDTPLWTPNQYVEWVNERLASKDKSITDLSSAFRSGDTLILLLEAVSGKVVRRPPVQKGGSVSMAMLDNIVAAFKFMGREGVIVDGRYTIKGNVYSVFPVI
jgi:hypothetical protein